MNTHPLRFRSIVGGLWLASCLSGQNVYPPGQSVEPGVLPEKWVTGGPRCIEVPDWQIHQYNDDFYILRQSGCTHYEKPFLYLIFGSAKALLIDTGAGETDVARITNKVLSSWLQKKKRTSPIPLVVMHSHAHGDHVAGDKQFQGSSDVTFIPASAAALRQAFHITPYPNGIGSLDLGSRQLDIIAIPGHEDASVAVFDRRTGILLTGDTFYPGRLYVHDWPAYAASAQRLVDFTEGKIVTHILGAHIEQTSQPYADYPRGTQYQPEEHELELTRGHLLEWNDAIKKANGSPTLIAMRDFTVVPRGSQTPSSAKRSRPEGQQASK